MLCNEKMELENKAVKWYTFILITIETDTGSISLIRAEIVQWSLPRFLQLPATSPEAAYHR